MATNKTPRRPKSALLRWTGFVHLLARYYQDYRAAVIRAGKRKRRRAVDIDVHVSKQGTMWALHWATVGKNKLHDPLGKIPLTAKIADLKDSEIERLRSKTGKQPHRVLNLLLLAYHKRVRVELELKVIVTQQQLLKVLTDKTVMVLNRQGLLQFKTLAALAHPENRLYPIHDVGGTTILSFTGYKGPGLDKKLLWPVTDYVRGRSKWLN